jgi:YVTN family beta-propeller protein
MRPSARINPAGSSVLICAALVAALGACTDRELPTAVAPPGAAPSVAPSVTAADAAAPANVMAVGGYTAYVANIQAGTVSVYRTNDNALLATIPVGAAAFDVDVTPDGQHVWVASFGGPIVVIRTSDDAVVATIPNPGEASHVAVSPAGTRAYVAHSSAGRVRVFSTLTNTELASVNVGSFPIGVAVTPDGQFIYVGNEGSDNVSVIRAVDNTVVKTISAGIGDGPTDIAISRDGARAYVTNWHGTTVSVIRTSDNTVVGNVFMGVNSGPDGIDITPDGQFAYVANFNNNTVGVIRLSDNAVVATIPVGLTPEDVAITPDGQFAYVTNRGGGSVSVIRVSDNGVLGSFPTGAQPSGIAFGPAQNAPPTVSAGGPYSGNEGSGFPLTATASDPNGDPVEFAWDLDDDGQFDDANGAVVTFFRPDDGTFTARVVGKDGNGGNATASTTVTIANVAPVVSAGSGGTVAEGGTFSGSGSFTDPGADTWSATVNYGDGSGTQPLALSGKTFALSHAYADDGSYTVSVTVADDDGGSHTAQALVTVTNVAPVVNAGPDATIDEGGTFSSAGSFADPGADTWSATVTYGDGAPAQPLALSPSRTFALGHAYADDGTYAVRVTVTDDDGGTHTDQLLVTVKNVAPTITSVTPGTTAPIAVGGGTAVAVAFTDPGTEDTHVGRIDCDASTPAVDHTVSPATSPFSRTCSYAAAGIYTVAVTVTDDDGGSDTESYEHVIVYDPAPHTTGGGWIDYAAASCPALCGGAAGRGEFSFNAQYHRGESVPRGNAKFGPQGFRFESTAYEWLVIAGGRAVLRGVGQFDRAGSYGFVLTITDGDPDRYRVRIWNRATGQVVFDNQMGAAPYGPAGSPLDKTAGNGGVQIHDK